jgi:hypothetical protein
VEGARRPEQFRRLHKLLRLWRLRAVAYSSPGYAGRLATAPTQRNGTSADHVIPGWLCRPSATVTYRVEFGSGAQSSPTPAGGPTRGVEGMSAWQPTAEWETARTLSDLGPMTSDTQKTDTPLRLTRSPSKDEPSISPETGHTLAVPETPSIVSQSRWLVALDRDLLRAARCKAGFSQERLLTSQVSASQPSASSSTSHNRGVTSALGTCSLSHSIPIR